MANRYESQHWVSPPPRPTELVAEVEWVIAFECGDFGSGITDVLGALLARLATAEQERDQLKDALRPAFDAVEAALNQSRTVTSDDQTTAKRVDELNAMLRVSEEWNRVCEDRAEAAEARVEALQPLIEAARLVEALDDTGGQDWWNAHQKLYDALARAALACPPQQPQKAGE